jgi:pentose-5-phosphate-3-epimerase
MISPGVLFYNLAELEHKLLQINSHYDQFLSLTKSEKILFHIDLILPSWAAKRGINTTPPFQRIYKLLNRRLENQNFQFDLHLMGEKKETIWLLKDIATQSTTMSHIRFVFVRQGYFKEIEALKLGFTIAKWYDLTEWNSTTKLEVPTLVMTVAAGEKGQVKTSETTKLSQAIISANPLIPITLDGGWSVEESSKLDKVTVVSSTSLWNTFDTLCLK